MKHHLYRWSVQCWGSCSSGVYKISELIALVGFRDTDTKTIRTSYIVSIAGREITTYSGSVYILEDIDTNYRDWLAENRVEYDPENPIKLRK